MADASSERDRNTNQGITFLWSALLAAKDRVPLPADSSRPSGGVLTF